MKRIVLVASLLAMAASSRADGGVSLETDGLAIDMGSDGRCVLSYPSLLHAEQKSVKPVSAVATGNTATVEYPGGARLAIERSGAAFTLHFTGMTNAARGFRMEMTLPGGFKDGATFQMKGEAARAFPAQFGGEQFIFKGEPKAVTLTGPGGGAFTIEMPYGWHQIQDGRTWQSENFDYMYTTAIPHDAGGEAWFTFKLWGGGLDQEVTTAAPAPAKPAPVAPRRQLRLRFDQEGLAIDAGADGQFTLAYPVFVGATWDDVRKPVERSVSGDSATLRFDGGASIEMSLQPAEGTLTMTPVGVPEGVRTLRAGMQIDFSYAGGGRWKIGEGPEKPFPGQKPESPHIHQGNADKLTLWNAAGGELSVQVPAGSFQQLTDNREWGWKVFQWQFEAPCAPGTGPLRVKIATGAAAGPPQKLADRFGQSVRLDFPGKVRTEEELGRDAASEAAWLAALHPPALDAFGGLPGSGAKLGLEKTGFFHVEKKGGRWILVDPEGNAFFHLGVCAFGPNDDYTYIAGREHVYEWLPPRDGEFASAFHPDRYWNPLAFSFHLANTIRKCGRPYDPADYTARMIERVQKWGFNSAGAFGAGDDGTRQRASFPHAAHLPLATWEDFRDVPGLRCVFDPFSDELRQRCDALFAEKLSPRADDPLVIGYFLANEPSWEDIPAAVAALDVTHPCKRRLAGMLEEKYATIEAFNRAWGTSLASFADVAPRGLPVKTPAAQEDMRAYKGLFLDAYFRLVTTTFRKYDKHHMLIGNRFQPRTIDDETTCRLSGKYMDVVSFNYYTHGFDADLLSRLRGWIGDRPMIFSEFYFSSPPDSGLIGGGKEVSSQRERGLAYRHYVEGAAALGYVVGIEWFTLVDQASTGRFFEKYGGEAANTGLISVADRPWKEMLAEMIKTNYEIYKVLFGERPPFVFDDPRFTRDGGAP